MCVTCGAWAALHLWNHYNFGSENDPANGTLELALVLTFNLASSPSLSTPHLRLAYPHPSHPHNHLRIHAPPPSPHLGLSCRPSRSGSGVSAAGGVPGAAWGCSIFPMLPHQGKRPTGLVSGTIDSGFKCGRLSSATNMKSYQ